MAKRYIFQARGATCTLDPDYRGIGEMLKYREFWPPLEAIAEKGKLIAEAISPTRTGDYKSSFEVVRGYRASPNPRVFARLQNTSRHALAVEYGTRATRRKGPPHRTLRKTARMMKGA